MRLEFDAKVSRAEQLQRTATAKQVGRKHNHQPSSRIREKRRAAASQTAKIAEKRKKERSAKVAAYWRGELDEHPA